MLTVRELKAALADAPEDLPVIVHVQLDDLDEDELLDDFSIDQHEHAFGAERRSVPDIGPAFVLTM